jgi:hypothetical protein
MLNFIFILLLSSFSSIAFCLEESSILLMQFKGKSLHREDDPDQDEYSSHWTDEDGNPIFPENNEYNTSSFINQWYYNGMYSETSIGSKKILSYINLQNSKLSIEKCNINRVYSKSSLKDKSFYKPLDSSTYLKKDNKVGNDVFSFIGDLSYKTTTKIGEEKGKGLDFHFNEEDNNQALCGNLGLNINMNSDSTNLIYQLKKRNYINKYIWTLKYQTEEDGIIVVGTEPHFYGSFYMSQFCTMKAIQNQSPDTAWSFKMNEVATYDSNNKKVTFSKNKVDFLIDRGLIIGTDEYKKEIDKLVFDDLISKKICFREVSTFNDAEKNSKDEYYIYYCHKGDFMENKYLNDKTYYSSFPNLDFYVKEHNYTFSLTRVDLFHEIFNRIYFLVVFKKSKTENEIWKLGEPFFSKFQFTFNQEQKTVGFYDSKLERISNEDFMKNLEQNNNNNTNKGSSNTALYVILIVIGVILLIGLAYFLGKKFNESRKRRANELRDDDFDYSADKKGNSNSNDIINDS